MKDELHINGLKFSAVRVAAGCVPYSKDYITKLAREHKIRAVHVGRNWYVDVDGLLQYQSVQTLENEARNRQLKLQRKTELEVRELSAVLAGTSAGVSVRFGVYALGVVCVLLTFGFVGGATVQQLASLTPAPSTNLAALSPDQNILVPKFTEVADQALVIQDRSIITPETETGWLRINYE